MNGKFLWLVAATALLAASCSTPAVTGNKTATIQLKSRELAAKAKVVISTRFNSPQRVFLDFVLSHYVSVGVEELDTAKLTPLLKLKYRDSIADAVADLGKPEEIGQVFTGFQRYLYQDVA